jgi:toxin ParE1/3/4
LKVSWSETGDESMDQLRAYFARFSEASARSWVRRIRAAASSAAVFPRSHRIVPELGDDRIRETFVYRYRIWYEIFDREDRIEVIVVFHGSREVPM